MRGQWGFFAVALGLLLYGGYCLVQSPLVKEEAQRLPRMTCAQLTQNGPGDHRLVVLTNACLSGGKSVAQRDSDTGALEMYHPIHAADLQPEPNPKEFRLIVCIMDELERQRLRDEREQRKQAGLVGQGELTSAVRPGVGHLPGWARDGLSARYPGIPLNECWLLTVGLNEPTPTRAAWLFWHGIWSIIAAVAAAALWLIWRRTARTGGGEASASQPVAESS